MTTTLSSGITLTDEQQQAVDLAVRNVKAGVLLTRIGGYAGTGKTTLIEGVRQSIDTKRANVCAYTGKAACVLRNKGIGDAQTIHSTIYKPHEVARVDPKTGKTKYVMEFGRIERDMLDCHYFILDEASMVGKEILDDLQSFNLPILAVGDPGQLEPISKHDVNLMRDPDFVLEKIHRQAAESGIIRLATDIRLKGTAFANSLPAMDAGDVVVAPKNEVRHDKSADIFICGMNKTRVGLNSMIRRRKNLEGVLAVGEQIICLSNDKALGIFNGLLGKITQINKSEPMKLYPRGEDPIDVTVYSAMVLWDGDTEPREMLLSGAAIAVEKPDQSLPSAHFGQFAMIDYGYAITCHKSQGSQWDNVAVMNERAPNIGGKGPLWNQARWLYTAVTRAAKNLKVGHEAA